MIQKIVAAFKAGQITKAQAIQALMENGVGKMKAQQMLQQVMLSTPPPKPERIGPLSSPSKRIAPMEAGSKAKAPSALKRK